MAVANNKTGFKIHKKFELQGVSYDHYPTRLIEFFFKALVKSDSKLNAIKPGFARKLGLRIYKTNVSTQKINGSKLETYEIVIALFEVDDKVKKFRFFEKIILLANINKDVAFGYYSSS